SIAELDLDDLAYKRLCQWGTGGPLSLGKLAGQARPLLHSHVLGFEAFGLVFLSYCSEVARRKASEGEVWRVIHESLGVDLRRSLFFNGYPLSQVREATERAVRKFHIRNVFGLEGAQAWMRTIFLQLGITVSGMKRLPAWLTGNYHVITL